MPDHHLIEQTVSSETRLQGGFLHVRRDVVALPDGQTASREFVVHGGAVVIVPVLDDGRLVVERQYRHPLRQVILEFPAGKIDPGESRLVCAARELSEETGYRAAQWACAGILHPTAAYSTELIEIWFAKGLRAGAAHLDAGEFIEVDAMSPADLFTAVLRGQLTDAKTLVGLLWWQQWQAGAWVPSWQVAPSAWAA